MTNHLDDAQVRNYLESLEDRLAQLQAEQSEEILTGIAEHINDALTRGGRPVGEVLASLGSPDEVLAAVSAQGPAGSWPPQVPTTPRQQSSSLWVAATCILLPFGAFLAGVGWLFGVAGLWMGTRWKTWEKVVGTVLVPGGIAGSIFLLVTPVTQSLSTGAQQDPAPLAGLLSIATAVFVLCLPILVAAYLLVVALRRVPSRQ